MDPEEILLGDQYSSWIGLVYIFNLIVGTGALTLPSVFSQAGWGLGTALLVVSAFISYITATFVVESMACANAIVHWKRLKLLKKDRSFQDSDLSSLDSDYSSDDAEGAPLFQNACRYYELDRKLELGEMATLFFNKPGRIIFYICFAVYLYGDLAIYSTAVSKSLADITCTYRTDNNSDTSLPLDMLCWSNSKLTRYEAYKLYLGAFILTLGAFVFFNVQKTKYLQMLTSVMRWLAFSVMIGLASYYLYFDGAKGHPKIISIEGAPALFGVCVYSFMCHHSIPGLIAPIRNKKHLKCLLSLDYLLICSFYLLLALTGTFAFSELFDLYTLNFIPSLNANANRFLEIVQYFLALFPIFTLSTSFPIIAITLKNNLITLFLNTNRLDQYNFIVRIVLIPLLAIIPPVLVAFFTENIKILVGFTGAYAGNAIQYLIPSFLVFYARRTCSQILGQGVKNEYQSPFVSMLWIYFVILWSVTCAVLVTVNFFWKHE